MSDTPKTDAATRWISGHCLIVDAPSFGGSQLVVPVEVAREMEHELAAAKAELFALVSGRDVCPVGWLEGPHGAFRANPAYRLDGPESAVWSIPVYSHAPNDAPWKNAVEDALVECHILSNRHSNDPRKALNDLLAWHQHVALDPAVSLDARTLLDTPPPDVWGRSQLMVLAAFRYCLGRQTYIVGDCTEWIKQWWVYFDDATRNLIRRDLNEEFEKDDQARADGREYLPLGADMDRREWCDLREFIMAEDSKP